jgi:cysteine desulfurase
MFGKVSWSGYNTCMDLIYLDNNATTRMAPEVVSAMRPSFEEVYGNPSSVHRFGQQARQAVEQARAQVAKLVGGSDREIMFTGGGTESINTALRGLLAARGPRKRIVTTSVEHSANREMCQELAKKDAELIEVGVDQQGNLDLDQWREAITDQTALASAMWANNETGVIFPVEELAKICRERGVPFHCDAVQAAGKIPVDVKAVGVDMLSLAAHKFHGPKGVGALYIRRGVRFAPLIVGGPQEHDRRGGTENVAGIVGLGKAAELAQAGLANMASQVAALRDRLERGILETIEQTHLNGRPSGRVPNTTNIAFAQLEAEAILLLLSERGICASAGAACSSGSLEPSHVLKAMKIPSAIAHGSLRFSLSRYTTEAEIDQTLQILPSMIARLRRILPVGA